MVPECVKKKIRPLVHRFIKFKNNRDGLQVLRYDRMRFFKYSGSFNRQSRNVLLARIIMAYHVLEKGLTMPEMRMGFGKWAVLELIELIEKYKLRYGFKDAQVVHAASCVVSYLELHKQAEYDMDLDSSYWNRIRDFVSKNSAPMAQMIFKSRESFFAEVEQPFPLFAASRHTVRWFDGKVVDDDLRSAVKLAMTAPSACNRQYVRVHSVGDTEMKKAILSLQNGNRGFGENADKLLVVTADLSGLRWHEERNDLYTNAGIFIMNLSYALHYKHIGSCILNWSVNKKKDLTARKVLMLPESETIVAVLAIGALPEEVKIAASPRKELVDILVEHE